MFFRLRNQNVHLIKSLTPWINAGTINLVTGKENYNDEVKLTTKDRAEIKDWLAKHSETMSLEAQLRALNIDKTIQHLANDVEAGHVLIDTSKMEEIEFAVRQLKQAMNKQNNGT